MGQNDRIDVGMLFIDLTVQLYRTAGFLSQFLILPVDAHQILGLQIFSILAVRVDDKAVVIQALGIGSLGAGEQLLVISAMNQIAHIPAGGLFLAGNLVGDKLVHFEYLFVFIPGNLLIRQGGGLSDTGSLNFQTGTEIQRLKGFESIGHGICSNYNAVIFQHNGVEPFFELLRNLLSQIRTSGQSIFGDGDIAAGELHVGDDAGVGNLANDGVGHQCRRMCMEHSPQIRTHLIDFLMERILRGRFMYTLYGSVGFDAHDVVAG